MDLAEPGSFDVHAQGIPLTIEARHVQRQEVLMGPQPASGFDDQITDSPAKRIDKGARELAEGGIGWAEERSAVKGIGSRAKVLGTDIAEVGCDRVHVQKRIQLACHRRPPKNPNPAGRIC
jgi:hypothetical protein